MFLSASSSSTLAPKLFYLFYLFQLLSSLCHFVHSHRYNPGGQELILHNSQLRPLIKPQGLDAVRLTSFFFLSSPSTPSSVFRLPPSFFPLHPPLSVGTGFSLPSTYLTYLAAYRLPVTYSVTRR